MDIGPEKIVAITTDNPTVMVKARALALKTPGLEHIIGLRSVGKSAFAAMSGSCSAVSLNACGMIRNTETES